MFYKGSTGIVSCERKVTKRINIAPSQILQRWLMSAITQGGVDPKDAYKIARLSIAIVGNAIRYFIDTIGLNTNQ